MPAADKRSLPKFEKAVFPSLAATVFEPALRQRLAEAPLNPTVAAVSVGQSKVVALHPCRKRRRPPAGRCLRACSRSEKYALIARHNRRLEQGRSATG